MINRNLIICTKKLTAILLKHIIQSLELIELRGKDPRSLLHPGNLTHLKSIIGTECYSILFQSTSLFQFCVPENLVDSHHKIGTSLVIGTMWKNNRFQLMASSVLVVFFI